MTQHIYIVGDSYSYGFDIFSKKYTNITTHSFFAEYIINILNIDKYIKQVFTYGVKNNVNIDIRTYDIIKQSFIDIKPDVMIFSFGQVDISFSYFYNKVYNVPYNIRTIINEYIRLIKKFSKKCKKTYVINFLPLFVDDTNDLISEYQRIHIKNLYDILDSKQLHDIFNIEKYRRHLYNSNLLLRKAIDKKKWKNEVIFVDANKYIYDGSWKKLKRKFYIESKKKNDDISITLDFHINAKEYTKCIIKNKLIHELNSIAGQ